MQEWRKRQVVWFEVCSHIIVCRLKSGGQNSNREIVKGGHALIYIYFLSPEHPTSYGSPFSLAIKKEIPETKAESQSYEIESKLCDKKLKFYKTNNSIPSIPVSSLHFKEMFCFLLSNHTMKVCIKDDYQNVSLNCKWITVESQFHLCSGASQESQTSRASITVSPGRQKRSSSSHLDSGSAPWHSGDVAHDIFGCHRLPRSALATEKYTKDFSVHYTQWTNSMRHLLRCQDEVIHADLGACLVF